MAGLSGSERAGTTDIKALDVGQVPADAWEFDTPTTPGPRLILRPPWGLRASLLPRALALPTASETSVTLASSARYTD